MLLQNTDAVQTCWELHHVQLRACGGRCRGRLQGVAGGLPPKRCNTAQMFHSFDALLDCRLRPPDDDAIYKVLVAGGMGGSAWNQWTLEEVPLVVVVVHTPLLSTFLHHRCKGPAVASVT